MLIGLISLLAFRGAMIMFGTFHLINTENNLIIWLAGENSLILWLMKRDDGEGFDGFLIIR